LVRRIIDYLLLILQWLLVLVGLLILYFAVRIRLGLSGALETADIPQDTVDWYRISQNLLVEAGVGLMCVGIGAALFYLRRHYFARR
jgi:hypothetical protein